MFVRINSFSIFFIYKKDELLMRMWQEDFVAMDSLNFLFWELSRGGS